MEERGTWVELSLRNVEGTFIIVETSSPIPKTMVVGRDSPLATRRGMGSS